MPQLPKPTYGRLRRFAACARYTTMLLIVGCFIATHFPGEALPSHFAAADKIAHCLVYFVLAVSVLASLDLTTGLLRPQHYFTVWLFGTLYGAFDEVTQIPVGRHCDGLDWLSDILGVVLGLTCYRLARPWIYRRANFEVAVN